MALSAINSLQASQGLIPSCSTCGKTVEKILKCGGCFFVLYCNQDCQKEHWAQHKIVCIPIKNFWARFYQAHKPEIDNWHSRFKSGKYTGGKPNPYIELLDIAIQQVSRNKIPDNKLFALDLGCGYGTKTIELLKNLWEVIAIDKEVQAIDNLHSLADAIDKNWLAQGKLTTAVMEVEAYSFPHRHNLIVITDVLPYCDPTKLKEIWGNMYRALDENGILIGSFFVRGGENEWGWQYNGVWFIDQLDNVRQLLQATFFDIIICRRRPKDDKISAVIEFCARKRPV